LTEEGVEKAEKHFGIENLSDMSNIELSHHINQALKANNLMKFIVSLKQKQIKPTKK